MNRDEFNKLQKENQEIRDMISGNLDLEPREHRILWNLINKLVNNEIEQEELCNR